jgi:hypothetical protein
MWYSRQSSSTSHTQSKHQGPSTCSQQSCHQLHGILGAFTVRQPEDIRQFRKATKKNKRFQNKFLKRGRNNWRGKRQCSGQKNPFLEAIIKVLREDSG